MKKFLLYTAVLTVGIWFSGFVYFQHYINNLKKTTESAEAIIVLTGGRNRINEAVKLFENKQAKNLLISGVHENISRKEIEKINDITLNPHIVLENESQNTVENAKETNKWLNQNNIKSIILVTSNYHLPRSIIEFRNINDDLVIIPYPVYSQKVAKEWWKNAGSFCLLASEYSKFVVAYTKMLINDLVGD